MVCLDTMRAFSQASARSRSVGIRSRARCTISSSVGIWVTIAFISVSPENTFYCSAVVSSDGSGADHAVARNPFIDRSVVVLACLIGAAGGQGRKGGNPGAYFMGRATRFGRNPLDIEFIHLFQRTALQELDEGLIPGCIQRGLL